MTLYRVSAQSLEVLSVSAASVRLTAQSLEVLTDTWQLRLPKAYGLVVLGPNPAAVALQKAYALAVIDDGSLPTYDPYWSNVVLLAHCEGSNAGTSFVDSSPQAHTLTAQGNAQTSTAQFKFGATSALLDGTGDYIDTPDSSDWSFGTGQFTVELWARFSSVGTQMGFVGQYESGGPAATASWLFSRNTSLEFRIISAAGASSTVTGAWTPSTNTWYHLAVDRDSGGVIRLYANGAVIGSGTNAGDIRDISTTPLRIGRSTGVAGTDVNGYIDDVRITKGVARYAGGTFAVPAAAFPDYGLVTGTASNTLGDATSSASGTYTNSAATGTGAATLGLLTSSATGAAFASITGTASNALGTLTSAGDASFFAETSGTGTTQLGTLTSSGTGTSIPPLITGTAGNALSALTSTATGTLAHTGAAASVLEALTSSGAAIHAAPVTGSSAGFLDACEAAGAGIHLQPVIGVGETTLEGLPTVTGTGEFTPPQGVVTWPPPRVRQVYLTGGLGRTIGLNATVRR